MGRAYSPFRNCIIGHPVINPVKTPVCMRIGLENYIEFRWFYLDSIPFKRFVWIEIENKEQILSSERKHLIGLIVCDPLDIWLLKKLFI